MSEDNGAPEGAFILAAGFGTRLRPYTNEVPKPMVAVRGEPMIDQALDKLADVGVSKACVNTHYKADVLRDHLAQRGRAPEVVISHEDEILDTGGGLVQGMAACDLGEAFYVLSGDSVWDDKAGAEMLPALAAAWDGERMDILMVLQPVESMVLTRGVGDYDLDAEGRAVRSMDQSGAYMFTSVRINAARIFDGYEGRGAFSYLELMDKAQAAGRLYGVVHEGDWHHISTPADLEAVNGE